MLRMGRPDVRTKFWTYNFSYLSILLPKYAHFARLCALSSRSPQSQFFYPSYQSGRLNAQKLDGSINAFDSSAGLLQDGKMVLALAASHF